MKPLKILLSAVLLGSIFVGGLKLGPVLQQAYVKVNPPPLYVVGDYRFTEVANTEVVIFSTSTCPYCKQLRSFLNANKISYTDYVTDVSSEAKSKFEQTQEKVVPVVFVGRRKFVGFNGEIGRAIENSVMANR